MNNLLNFFAMGGYGNYVWSAYGVVAVFLLLQWLIPWTKWRKYLQKPHSTPGVPTDSTL